MEPKRIIFSIQSSPIIDDFSSQQQEGRFFQEFASKTVFVIHILDVGVFQKYEFFKVFEDLKLRTFFCSPSRMVYPSLVKMFFFNIYFTDGIVFSEIRKNKIHLPLKDFVKTLDLPNNEALFNPDEQCDKFNHKIAPFIIGIVRLNICLIHYMVNHIIFPRKIKFIQLTRCDMETVWVKR